MKKVIVLGALFLLVAACKASTEVHVIPEPSDTPAMENDRDGDEDEDDDEMDQDDDRDEDDDEDDTVKVDVGADVSVSAALEVAMTSQNFSYTPNVLTAKVGQEVVLTITNEGFHDIVIDELGVSQKLEAGVNTVRFTPTKAGTFEFYCSIGTHRQMGMKGTLTVTE